MQTRFRKLDCALVLVAAFALGACAPDANPAWPDQAETSALDAAPPTCADCGTIRDIQALKRKGDATGAGAVIGAVVGGVIGHQFGSGRAEAKAKSQGFFVTLSPP